ncbi:hypothetical protein A11A3_15764 [Alcanivorax hongdengensis A-11-3]|uniref:Integral membrane protein n=1 Tax=Alcanivorax hongdengensis A-11-3 TaxID=1177179 RepID=L0WAA9_9GAMM|nr:hypothetical protein [Alcanivorax hongdengensis]EKF73022.1 hypothetical protein A11A3_15764 [Alcanivorax hongdengensis A-11-3]
MTAVTLALWSCGIFFLVGLLTGVWKYLQIRQSSRSRAHYYVDVAHRASLMYAFACLVLERFARLSVWSETVNTVAVLASVLFFALAVGSYILHGWLQDTRNQLQPPHRVGGASMPAGVMALFMWALVVAEIGGFLVLFSGFALA